MRRAALLLAALAAGPTDAACVRVPDLLTPAMFARYPAVASAGPWRTPDVRSGQAHDYRTMIRTYGVGKPDFAGHYRVVAIGCGAATVCPAIVDGRTGRVFFDPALRSVTGSLTVFVGDDDVGRLTYRRNSRMLAAFGFRNEQDGTEGMTLFEWRANQLHVIRFVPDNRLCREKDR